MTSHVHKGLLIAHGSRDPRHADAIQRLAAEVATALPRMTCDVAFLQHNEPRIREWLDSHTNPGVRVHALGLFLASGYHANVDVPRELGAGEHREAIRDVGTLGTAGWAPPVLERLVREAGGTPDAPVVLTAAGSTSQQARDDLRITCTQWQQQRPGRVLPAAMTGPDPSPGVVIEALGAAASDVVVVPLMVAPGAFADRLREAAAAAGARCAATITSPEHTPPELVSHLARRLAECTPD